MPTQPRLSLHTLPIEMIYRILDQFDDVSTIFWSLQSVCQRLNKILNTYQRYKTRNDRKQNVTTIFSVTLDGSITRTIHISNSQGFDKQSEECSCNIKWSLTVTTIIGNGYSAGSDQLSFVGGIFIEPKT
ncbi:unnamed protein product [Rotaria socialis]|uniref:F-box domain-containing protein n=1 Tax=Rotaria socialis TaxID=392032 RepID=A0A817QK53_9BILA|nr:unnamed protein product [Rotaria socialis]CAF3343840.1 unnamed protein product [Rotaria socialis]CAF3605688.1 unnamed protein product [Rotaria socialis]